MTRRSFALLTLVLAAAVAPLRANPAEELTRIHIEAIGGQERIAALSSLRATGQVVAGNKRMRFTLLAARPDRVRVETENGGRTLVQVSDGKNPPWEFDTGTWPPRYRDMASNVAKTFAADAEFDDPLIAGASRGFVIEYAGETELDGKKLHRLLVTRKLHDTFSLLLDSETFLIVRRIEQRKSPLGQPTSVITGFAEYRPVAGVLVPHDIRLISDGRLLQQTRIETIEPNPEISADAFTRPRAITFPQR